MLRLFFAGHETTSHALSSLFYYIKKFPETEEKILNEIKAKLPELLEGDLSLEKLKTVLTNDRIIDLEYLSMAIKEAMRIDSTVEVSFMRKVNVPFNLGGVHFPKGVYLSHGIMALNNNPDVFPNPRKFIPDRFNSDSEHFLTADK